MKGSWDCKLGISVSEKMRRALIPLTGSLAIIVNLTELVLCARYFAQYL